MYHINTLKQELSPAKTCVHNLLNEKHVVWWASMAYGVFVDENQWIIAGFLRYTGHLNFMKDPISRDLFELSFVFFLFWSFINPEEILYKS